MRLPEKDLSPEQRARLDAGKRVADRHNLVLLAEGWRENMWMAFRLHDGDSDGRVYGSRAEAVRFQLHETWCMYIAVCPAPMTAVEAAVLLTYNRRAYDAGYRVHDPDPTSKGH